VKLTVLGSCGAWPAAGSACSGFLVEHDGFRLLLDAGYATFPKLLAYAEPQDIDAVLITHGHPDHCADLNPLLRARRLADRPALKLPVHALPHALDAVLALDRPGMLEDAYQLHEIEPSDRAAFEAGPFRVQTRLLPHWEPNVGFRLTAGERTLVYTGDTGPDRAVVELAEAADLLIAEATYPEPQDVPTDSAAFLTSAHQAAVQASQAAVGELLLTHMWPGADAQRAVAAASSAFGAPVDIAAEGLVRIL